MTSASLLAPPVDDISREEAAGSSSPSSSSAVQDEIVTKRRYNLTPTEQQALHIQKLLSKPDREVVIPKPLREKELRAPREMIKNVSGSSAGAGSGEFHVYKHARRREYERIKLMEDKDRKEREVKEYQERQEAMQEQEDAKTKKNRAKREKKKNAKLAAKGGTPTGNATTAGKRGNDLDHGSQEDDEDQGKRKRINASGTAQIVFRKKGDESEEADADDDE
ncbi:hypothetical protein CBS101457_000480 [Exobasidium rhododendri]|nr:hypothetical protein CBS101457_000480 [Exobasidium rhododendri]